MGTQRVHSHKGPDTECYLILNPQKEIGCPQRVWPLLLISLNLSPTNASLEGSLPILGLHLGFMQYACLKDARRAVAQTLASQGLMQNLARQHISKPRQTSDLQLPVSAYTHSAFLRK